MRFKSIKDEHFSHSRCNLVLVRGICIKVTMMFEKGNTYRLLLCTKGVYETRNHKKCKKLLSLSLRNIKYRPNQIRSSPGHSSYFEEL